MGDGGSASEIRLGRVHEARGWISGTVKKITVGPFGWCGAEHGDPGGAQSSSTNLSRPSERGKQVPPVNYEAGPAGPKSTLTRTRCTSESAKGEQNNQKKNKPAFRHEYTIEIRDWSMEISG